MNSSLAVANPSHVHGTTLPLHSSPACRESAHEALETKATRPLNTLFLLTSMPVGGAETLLVNLIGRFRRPYIHPSIGCLKELGPLGEQLANDWEVTHGWLKHKWDVGVVRRLARHMRQHNIDAVITVGAGDKMFWGRIAARLARVPVIASALHSTGWPDGVGRLNRWLTPITDSFIAVAKSHGEFLVDFERFPKSKVVVIPNGVDTQRFQPSAAARNEVRAELGIAHDAPVIGIVAALRPEKNHQLFLQVAHDLIPRFPHAQFIIVGDGPERETIERRIESLGIEKHVRLLGTRSDTPRLLTAMDVFALTSHNEASPVSILEAFACGVPVVSTRVGSVAETVHEQWSGFTVDPGDVAALVDRVGWLLSNRETAQTMGNNGREHVEQNASLDSMVAHYEQLIHRIWSFNRVQP